MRRSNFAKVGNAEVTEYLMKGLERWCKFDQRDGRLPFVVFDNGTKNLAAATDNEATRTVVLFVLVYLSRDAYNISKPFKALLQLQPLLPGTDLKRYELNFEGQPIAANKLGVGVEDFVADPI